MGDYGQKFEIGEVCYFGLLERRHLRIKITHISAGYGRSPVYTYQIIGIILHSIYDGSNIGKVFKTFDSALFNISALEMLAEAAND